VVRISTAAFKYLSEGKWEQAFNSITALKGIGVATASAIFAPFRPDLIPFMADEVIDSTCVGKRDYTMKVYKYLRDKCISKAKELGTGWDAEMVGKALWVRAMVAKHTSFKMAAVDDTTAVTHEGVDSNKDAVVMSDLKETTTTGASISNHSIDRAPTIAGSSNSTIEGDSASTSRRNTKRKRA